MAADSLYEGLAASLVEETTFFFLLAFLSPLLVFVLLLGVGLVRGVLSALTCGCVPLWVDLKCLPRWVLTLGDEEVWRE